MVNTHRKYPVEAKHNTYYAADGSDLRDATEEEIEKYRLAASHKRGKPESSGEKSESVRKKPDVQGDTRAHRTDEEGRVGHSSRDRGADRRPHDETSKGYKDHTSSRGSRGGRDDGSREKSRGETTRKSGTERSVGGRSSERDQQSRVKSDEIDEDERDRCKVSEIMRRMEDRKARKASEVAQKAVLSKGKPKPTVDSKTMTERRDGGDVAKGATRETVKPSEVPKKKSNIQREAADADTAQRDAAMSWASGETSDTNAVTQSAIGKNSIRQRGTKKANEKLSATVIEYLQSIQAQNFIAGQYPPVEEEVSSTVRLGRALVSGALGRRNDDPKMFGVAVDMMECSVNLQTTNKKAKAPVSAAPPNSIDSEVEGGAASNDTTCDVQLSQSVTDLGTQIELPGGGLEAEAQGKDGIRDAGRKELEASVTPVPAGFAVPPPLSYAEDESGGSGHRVRADPEILGWPEVGDKMVRSPRNVILAEFNRMMEEIDVSTLVRNELIRTEPHPASAAFFLSVVSGGASPNKIERKSEVMIERTPDVAYARSADVAADAAAMMTEIIADVGVAVPSGPFPWEIRYAERQQVTRITASKSLLNEELKKKNPSSFAIAAFR